MKWLGTNWKTNLAAILSFLLSVPQFVTAIQSYIKHEPADWRGAIAALVVALGLLASKDSTTHSTVDQVAKSTAEQKPGGTTDEKVVVSSSIVASSVNADASVPQTSSPSSGTGPSGHL